MHLLLFKYCLYANVAQNMWNCATEKFVLLYPWSVNEKMPFLRWGYLKHFMALRCEKPLLWFTLRRTKQSPKNLNISVLQKTKISVCIVCVGKDLFISLFSSKMTGKTQDIEVTTFCQVIPPLDIQWSGLTLFALLSLALTWCILSWSGAIHLTETMLCCYCWLSAGTCGSSLETCVCLKSGLTRWQQVEFILHRNLQNVHLWQSS